MFQHKSSFGSIFKSIALGLGLCALALLWLASGPASLAAPAADTWFVDAATGDDGDDCLTPGTACATLGEAVNKAVDGDTIEIAAGVYNEHDILIFEDLTINGAGAASTILDAGTAGRMFSVGSAVTISGVRIQNGQTPASGAFFDTSGGAVFTSGGANLIIQDSILIDNHASSSGGAIFNIGNLILENTQVLSNTAGSGGGGIYNYNLGVITVTQSTLAYNTSSGSGVGGGGIYAGGRGLTVQDSTLSDNSATYFGGGVYIAMNGPTVLDGVTLSENRAVGGAGLFSVQGSITGTNVTVSGNNATNDYGGIYISGPSTSLFLKNSTIAYNTRTGSSGAGMNALMTGDNAVASYVNTILSNNQENNCSSFSPPTSLGYNLSDDTTCGLTQTGDQPGVDPLLAPLADNGGMVQTHALIPGSPAIDAGDNAQCPATDARSIARPFDGDGDSVAVCDIGAVEVHRQLSIADSTVTEGDSGTVTAVFTVTLAPTSTTTVEVDYATQDDTADSGVDYTAASDTLTFDPGETEKTISISVTSDADDEVDETFLVQLSNAVNADLLDAEAVGTIVDDDGLPTLSIADQSILEGSIGTTVMQFEATLSPSSSSVVTVDYATSNGTATAGSDYTAKNDTLTFQPGETSMTISIDVLSDIVDEGLSEAFSVQLSNPANAAFADDQATGTITDDDEARLSQHSGPQALEGDSGFTPAVFTVTISTPAAFVVTVDFDVFSGVGDEGAQIGVDFVPISGTLTFQPGDLEQTYTVQIIGDTLGEKDESYSSLISNANVPISVNGSLAKILNDDNYLIYIPLLMK